MNRAVIRYIRKMLRSYQQGCFNFVFRHVTNGRQEVVISGPTGCGKTLTVTYLVERLLQTPQFLSAVIVAPQTQIQDGFFHTDEEGRKINLLIEAHPPETQESVSVSVLSDLLVDYKTWGSSSGNRRDRDLFCQHVRASNPSTRVFVTTHQAVTHWFKDPSILPADLKGRILVIDEAHHASVLNQIGAFAKAWLDRGGVIIHLTATPFRTEGDILMDESAPRWTLTLAEHLMSGFAPHKVEIISHPIPLVARTVDQLAGNKFGSVTDRAASVQAIVDLLVKDGGNLKVGGDHKSVVIVPPIGAEEWATALQAKLEAQGFRVFNAVKGGAETSAKLKLVLAAERRAADKDKGHFTQSKYDVILACARFNEGTDWAFCSHIYNIGLTNSFLLVLQRLGRGMRPKFEIPGYPERHQDHVVFTFLVPSASEAIFTEFEQRHQDHAFMTACFMADVTTGQGYLNDITRKLDASRSRTGEYRCSDETWADVIQFLQADLQNCRKAAGHMVQAINALQHEGVPKPTDGQVVAFLTSRMGLAGEDLNRAIRALQYNRMKRSALAFQGFKNRLMNKLRGAKDFNGDPRIIRQDMQPVFDEMLAEFAEEAADVDLTAAVVYHMSEFTGQKAVQVARSMRQRFGKPQPTEAEITTAILAYHRGGGVIPPVATEDASVHFGYAPDMFTWQDVNNRLAVLEKQP